MKIKGSTRRQTTNGKSIVNRFRGNNDCSTFRRKKFSGQQKDHGPWVLQRTYKKRIDELKAEKAIVEGLNDRIAKLGVALKNYYTTHNRKVRCDCGHCLYARKLVDFPVLGLRDSLDELKEEMERCWEWPT